jgi:hypothetical protein
MISFPSIFAVCKSLNIPAPVFEFLHIPGRRFRLDYAWPDHRIGLEVQGGIWTRGKHSRGAGQKIDMEKNNLGILHGWRVFQCVPGREVQTIVDFIKPAMQSHTFNIRLEPTTC